MMIWILMLLQAVFMWIGWWVYNVYYTEPKHAHPSIFWNPLARAILAYVPTIGIFVLIVSAFFITNHPWFFLIFSVVLLLFSAHKMKKQETAHIMPVLTEDGIEFETFTTEELRNDIRKWKAESEIKDTTP
jgi:magnesium-transporting ATPase (P-type)